MLLPLLLTLTVADTGKTIKFTGDAGFVNTTGNTEISTINVGDKLEFSAGGWGVVQTFAVIYGRSEGETTTSLWRGALRGDRAISARVGAYVLGEFDRNTFAGIRGRYAPSIGLTALLLESPKDKLRAEAGAGYVWQRGVAPAPDQEFSAGRGALLYERLLGAKSKVTQALEFLPNFKAGDDLRINSETAITAPIVTGVAMKASYVIRYDGLPEPGFKTTDRILTTGVQVTF